MTVAAIIKRVREYLDEVEAVNYTEVLNGSVPINDRIRSLIPECALYLSNGREMDDSITSTLTVDAEGMGTMEVPEDFGRLYEMRLSCWKRSVYDVVGIDSTLYAKQKSIATRGGTCRPVVAITPYNEGRRFELYSIPVWDKSVKVERAAYIPVADVGSDDANIDVDARKEALLCYMIAVRAARTYGNEAAVKLLGASLAEEQQKISLTK